jgi:hypothetical protein
MNSEAVESTIAFMNGPQMASLVYERFVVTAEKASEDALAASGGHVATVE